MNYKRTTQVPNEIFDIHLAKLSFSEMKILLYIIRQTFGWKLKNGKRKSRDRITHGQFITKTGLSRRIISKTIQNLITKQLIKVTDFKENLLHEPNLRKGKMCIYFAPCVQTYALNSTKVCKQEHKHVQNRVYNKTNNTKLNRQKGFSCGMKKLSDGERIRQVLLK